MSSTGVPVYPENRRPVPQVATFGGVVKREDERTRSLILHAWRELLRVFALAQARLPVLLKSAAKFTNYELRPAADRLFAA